MANSTIQSDRFKLPTVTFTHDIADYRTLDNDTSITGMPKPPEAYEQKDSTLMPLDLPQSFRNLRYVQDTVRASNGSCGLDGMLLGSMAVALNFTAETMDATDRLEYGYRLANDTFVGSLGDLLNHRTDVSFNVRFLKYYDTHDIEFLKPIYSDQLCILSPKSLEIPEWLAIFLCFHPFVWASFVTIGFVGGYLWCVLRRWALRKVRLYRIRLQKGDMVPSSTLTIELWLVLLGASSIHLPVRGIERLLLIAFLVANVIISGTFQGTLTTAFSTVTYYEDINTLAALDRSGLSIGTSSRSLLDIFGNVTGSPLYESLKSKLHILNVSARHRAAFERDICSIERRSDVHLIINTAYMRPNGQPMLHVVKECPRMYSLAHIVRSGWSFAPMFNDAISRFIESGLTRKWSLDIENALTTHKRIQQTIENPEEETLRKLTLMDMQTSFYIVVIGVVVGFAVFAIELFTGK
uniref:Ionotropic glutamate receptor C-terminal domain-containing protein n=1 Tax=Anopheles albimanus TaxID=7167 RepID=A0A182FQW0_ANOAL